MQRAAPEKHILKNTPDPSTEARVKSASNSAPETLDDATLSFGAMLPELFSTDCAPQEHETRLASLVGALDECGYDIAWLAEASLRLDSETLQTLVQVAASNSRALQLGIGMVPTQGPVKTLVNKAHALAALTGGRMELALRSAGTADTPAAAMLDELVPQLTQIPLSLAAQTSPQSATLAGGWRLPLMSVAATTSGGFSALPTHWELYTRLALQQGLIADRQSWTLAAPMHLAPTREQAMAEINNAAPWATNWLGRLPAVHANTQASSALTPAQALVDAGIAVIGTPDDAVALLRRLQIRTGGFGRFLQILPHWTDTAATTRSLTLFADQVMPAFPRSRTPMSKDPQENQEES